MAAGALRKRVYFESQERTSDGGGGSSVAWTAALTVWGQLSPERGREKLAAGRLESADAAVLKIRSSSESRAIDASWRATIDDIAYQIRSVNEDPRRRFVELVLEKGVAV